MNPSQSQSEAMLSLLTNCQRNARDSKKPSQARNLVQITSLLLLAGVLNVQAQTTYIKANNTTALTTSGSWTVAGTPGTGDIVKWDSTVTAANITVALGGAFSVGQIQISNPGGNITISDTANTLTLNGVSGTGINNSAATRDLTIGSALSLGGSQTWTIPTGRNVTQNGQNGIAFGTSVLTIAGGGTFTPNERNNPVTASSSSAGAGIVLKGSSLSCTIQTSGASAAYINYLGANTAFTSEGGTSTYGEVGSSGNHRQAYTGLTLNSGNSQFGFTSRQSSSGQSIGFATLARNIGSTANFDSTTSGIVAFGGSTHVYGLPGSATLGYATLSFADWCLPAGASTRMAVPTYVNDTWASGNNTTVTVSSSPASGSTTGTLRFGQASTTTTISSGTSGQNTIVVASAVNLGIGAGVSGTGIPANTYITGIAGTTITLSANLTAASSGTLVYGPSTASTVTLSGNNVITTGGILNNFYSGTLAEAITGGTLTSGNTTADGAHDLICINNNSIAGGNLVINSAIVDNGASAVGLTKAGVGALILGGANTFTGPSYVNGGTVQLNASGAWGGNSALNFAPNGSLSGTASTFTLNGNNATVGGLAITQTGITPTVQNANATAATLTINLASGNNTFSGTLQNGTGAGVLSLAKSGAGTETLGGTLSYGGSTTVSAGTLALTATPSATTSYTVNGTLDVTALGSSTLPLTGSQSLTGSGTVNGTVTTVSGTKLAPGNGTTTTGGSGTNTVSNLPLVNGVVMNFGLSASDSNNCQESVTGTLTLPASGTVTLNLYSPGTSTPFAAAGNYNLFKYTTGVNVSSLASRFTIGTLTTGYIPTFGTAAGPGGTTYVVLTLTASAGVVASWTNNVDGNWSTAVNWDPNSVPQAAGDAATLGASTGLRTITLDANETVGTLAMTNANSFVVANANNTLTIDHNGNGAGVTVSAGTANDIQTSVALSENTFVSVSSGKSLRISGIISNTAAASPKTLTVNGAGTTILSAANLYGPAASSVGTTLSGGGTLQVGNNNALGAGDVNVTGSSAVQAGAAGLSVGNNIALGTGVTGTVDNNGNNATLGGTISGSGGVSKISSGILTLSGANTYSGGTTIGAGVVSVSADGASAGNSGNLGVVPASATANNVILNGGDLLGSGTFVLHANRGIGIGATSGSTPGTGLIDAAAGQTLTASGIIASAGNTGANNLTVNSIASTPGTVILNGVNTFSGTTVISGGTLTLGNSLALQNSTLNYNSQGGALSFGSLTAATLGALNGAQNLSLLNGSSAAVALTIGGNNASSTYSGALSGTGASLTKAGTGTLTLTGNNSYSGSTVVNTGVLELDSGGVISHSTTSANVSGNSSAELYVNGGSLTASSFNISTPSIGLLVASGSASISGALNLNTGNASQSGLISVTGGSLSAGSLAMGRMGTFFGSQPIAGATTYGFYVNGGTVNITNNVSVCTQADANSANSMRIDSGSLTIGGSVTLGGGSSGGRWTPLDVNGGTLTVTNTTTGINIGNNNSGTAGGSAELLIRDGTATAGRIGLGGSSGFTGSGVLNQTGGSLYVGSGGIVYNGFGTATITLNGGTLGAAADWSSSMNMTLGGTTIQAADASSTARNISLSGVLSGTTLTKTGGGTLTLASSGNNYSGLTTISGGTLNINSEWALGGANYAGLTFSGSGGTLQYAATLLNSTTDLSIQPVSLLADSTIDVNGNAISFANPIGNSGSGALTVKSTIPNGSLTLNGANTYTGGTTISSGTLLVNGSIGNGAVNVAVGATLGGNGTLGGATTVNGTIAPSGTFPATLTVNNTLDFAGTSSFSINATTNDRVAGVTAFTSGGTLNVTLQSGALTGGETFKLVQATTYGGTASTAGTLPTLGSGLNWYLGNLPVNGSITVNRAPVANAKTYGVAQGEVVVISVSGGAKSLTTDADTNSLTFISLGDTNAVDFGTANITGGGTSITYQNTSGAAGDVALFSYIVSDSRGGLATNSVSIQISPATGANLVSATAGGGNAYLTYAGIPGTNYALDHATSIVYPITWTPVQTKPAETNGFLRFTNNLSTYPTNDFYRTRYVP